MSIKSNHLTLNGYKNVLDNLPYGVIVADITGKFVFWNGKALPMFGGDLFRSEKENWVEDFGIYKIDTITKYETEDLPMSKALQGKSTQAEKMYVRNVNNKEGVFLKISSYPILSINNEIEGGVIIFEDITQEQLLYDNIIYKINELENYLKDIMELGLEPKNI